MSGGRCWEDDDVEHWTFYCGFDFENVRRQDGTKSTERKQQTKFTKQNVKRLWKEGKEKIIKSKHEHGGGVGGGTTGKA